MAGRKLMSLEAAMEEERQQIEALLSQQPSRGPPMGTARSPSPYMSPRSPVRSMLDVGNVPGSSASRKSPAQVRSMLDIDSPTASAPFRSMLSVVDSPPATTPKSPVVSSAKTSPTLSSHRVPVPPTEVHHRSMSDASTKPLFSDFGQRSPPLARDRNVDPTTDYKFSDIYATNVGQALPVRRAQGNQHRSGSIGEALKGSDLSNLVLPGDLGRSPFSLRGNSKSKSPHNRFNLRSNSPHANLLGSSTSRNRDDGTITLDDGQVIDKHSAYRRLSDANLVYGGSSLASLPRKKSDPDGHGRIEKSNMSPYGEILTDDDSDDEVANSSDEEDHRGRKLTTRAESRGQDTDDVNRPAKSLLAAAEDERQHIASQPQYRSLLDPEIMVTSPNGEKARKSNKRSVQPSTSFDQDPPTRAPTPDPNADQDDQDVNAIKRAQDLGISSTPIISNPEVHRSIRILYRGEYNRIQQHAVEEHRRLRKYLVAMDLSDESTHALEWAIGTVLRDGDTLIAFYCMDEEASGSVDANSQVPDDPRSMREQAAVVNAMTKNTKPPLASTPSPFSLNRANMSPRVRAADPGSNTPSPAPSRGKTRLEEERERSVQDVTDRVSKLLRKTQLEVRVIIECIHCKNPKHLITEVIDLVCPTLVILGSRGRSALKGTLLGSFSNYLVTKSSAPVMVARKRLRKKSKYQAPPRQINNLSNPAARSLETARID
ncbi:universal stress protein [Seiridium cupressi]